jgi:hypothetical protein
MSENDYMHDGSSPWNVYPAYFVQREPIPVPGYCEFGGPLPRGNLDTGERMLDFSTSPSARLAVFCVEIGSKPIRAVSDHDHSVGCSFGVEALILDIRRAHVHVIRAMP